MREHPGGVVMGPDGSDSVPVFFDPPQSSEELEDQRADFDPTPGPAPPPPFRRRVRPPGQQDFGR